MQKIMHKCRFNVRICFHVLCNDHRLWPTIMNILCNIANFLACIHRLLFNHTFFLVGVMLWNNQDSVT